MPIHVAPVTGPAFIWSPQDELEEAEMGRWGGEDPLPSWTDEAIAEYEEWAAEDPWRQSTTDQASNDEPAF